MNENTSDKALFASYLNMCTCNVDTVFYHIEKKFHPAKNLSFFDGSEKFKQLEIVKEFETGNAVKQEQILKQIVIYIPFFKVLFETKKPKSATEKLALVTSYINLLFDMRNYYSHTIHDTIGITGKTIHPAKIFEANIRIIKERFSANEIELNHLRKKIGKKENKNFHYHLLDKNQYPVQFTEKGLLFFTSLFLEKKYAFLLLKQYTGFKDSRENWKKYTLETYTASCLRLPKERIDSTESEATVGMDIASELCKCPDRLFHLLSTDDKKNFSVPVNDKDPLDEQEPFLKRFADRFPYFAMRYLEFKKLLPGIFFHIDMGNYFFDRYEKSLIDGSTIDDRRLSKRILGFSPLQGAIDKFNRERESGLYQAKYKGGDVFMNETLPHYHLNNNQIGIKLSEAFPNLNGKQTALTAPDAWLSIYELPILVYLCIKGKANGVSCKIKNHIENSKQFFKDVDKGIPYNEESLKTDYKIDIRDLPKVFRKKQKDYARLAEEAIEKEITKTEKLLENFKKEQKYTFKPGKKAQPKFKSGHIADILIADFLKFQPSDRLKNGADKITSPNYQVLQVALAYYGREKERIPLLLKNEGLTQGENQHPFLKSCLPLEEESGKFFTKYLRAKIKYLKKILESGKTDVYFLRSYTRKAALDLQAERRQTAQNLSNLPVNLPRGLFKDLFKNAGDNNPSFMIRREFADSGDDVQPFYKFSRTYPKHIAGREDKKADYDKKIRFTEICDIVSFYMMKDLLQIRDVEVKLKSHEPDNYILSQTDTLKVPFSFKYKENGNKTVKHFVLTGKDMKIKNYGNFKRLLSDKRLRIYCQHFEDNHIFDYDSVEKEFHTYDILRSEVFEKILLFEKTVIDKHNLNIKGKDNRIEFKEIVSHSGLQESEANILQFIRNAFFHHDYMERKYFERKKTGSLTEEMGAFCKQYIDVCTEKVKQIDAGG